MRKCEENVSLCVKEQKAGIIGNTTVSRLRSLGIDVRIKNRVPVYKGKEISCCDWINC